MFKKLLSILVGAAWVSFNKSQATVLAILSNKNEITVSSPKYGVVQVKVWDTSDYHINQLITIIKNPKSPKSYSVLSM